MIDASSESAACRTPAAAFTPPFDNSYARELEGFYVPWTPVTSPAARLLQLNTDLACELGLAPDALASPAGLAVLAGNAVPSTARPLAQAYAGHQFGHFSPQLGDGRALLLGELMDRHGMRRDVALKGSGRTPFSRNGDGLAALGPVLREYLMGEAMHALAIPTTRALAVVATGVTVRRERPLPGGLLTRVAASHLRVGTFEFFSAWAAQAQVRRLADYAIKRHYPELADVPQRYLALLSQVIERQAALVAHWMAVGFVHGVMNTDNMTISGETIDYGPCAMIEQADPKAVFSSIDTGGRYAFGNQPQVAQWNLACLARTLEPLIDPDPAKAADLAANAVHGFAARYEHHWRRLLHAKLGLAGQGSDERTLADDYLTLLQTHRIDHTLGFRRLVNAATGDDAALLSLFGEAASAVVPWLQHWQLKRDADQTTAMRRINPIYIARHHQVEAALTAAVDQGNLMPFERLLGVLRQPYDERDQDGAFAQPAPAEQTACYKTYCGT